MIKISNFIKIGNFFMAIICMLIIWQVPQIGHADQNDLLHQIHLYDCKGPSLGTNCTACHTSGTPTQVDVSYELCILCHSPDGAYDGMNDTVIGARYNWGDGIISNIYNSDGQLKPGKEKWCVGCHDDGNSIIQGVSAPNIAGKSLDGSWESPISINEDHTNMSNPTLLLDNDFQTGTSGTYVTFDFGSSKDVSHIRLYTAANTTIKWEVWGGNDLNSLERILYGQAIIWGSPTWETNSEEGWNEIRLDKFISMRYIKLVKISPWPIPNNALREFEVKKDLEYGYYTTGHKINCLSCHYIQSVHCDGVSQTYRSSFDNYQTAFRLNNVNVDGEIFPSLEIPRVGCNWEDYPRIDNDFALCFSCHDKYKLLGDAYGNDSFYQDPLQTNFRNDEVVDINGKVINSHLRHLRGRGYCGNATDWDSDWDGVADSPQSCPACHNVHGSPAPAMTRHGELASPTGTANKAPMMNLQYLDSDGNVVPDLTDVMESIGGKTQYYGAGAGTVARNKICNTCHNDSVTYYRSPVAICQGCHADFVTNDPSHYTHILSDKGPRIECWNCHDGNSDNPHTFQFVDGNLFTETQVCNVCHSPDGYYNGVDDLDIGAKANWTEGVYQNYQLKPGKDKWCATCHDNQAANSRGDNTGVNAPNIIGDDLSYGYYITGHKIVCTECHDPSFSHIDHKHRTYTAASLNYQEGYRLKSVDGSAPLMVPRLTGGNPQSYPQYFALCFSCHNKYEILGTNQSSGSFYKSPVETNFNEETEGNRNGHYLHLGFGDIHWDSDWDMVADSCENCTTCHNVHGSLTPAMIRHGELISTPDTQDKVPALNFYYYRPSDEVATATFDPALTVEEEGMYAVSAYWVDGSNRATNAPYTIHYYDTSTSTYVDETVRVDQKNIGKVWYRLGGEDKEYFLTTDSYIMLSNDNANNYVIADAIRLSKDGVDRDIDNLDAHVTYFPEGEWPVGTPSGSWGDNIQFHAKQEGIIDNDIAVSESIGGRMMMAGYHIDRNKVCGTCHGDVSYFRTPYLGPRFLNIGEDSLSITTDTESVCLKAGVLCNDSFTVRIDLSPIGGNSSQALFNDGTHCDSVIGDYIYSYEETIQEALEDGHILLTIIAETASLERTRQILLAITDPAAIYVDNLDVVSEWLFVLSTENTWNDSAQYHAGGGTGSNTFTFVPQIPVDGYYNIYSWWTAHDNRASDAPYTIRYYNETSQIYETVIIEVNQQQNGNMWNYLGNYYLKAGSENYLRISDAASDPTTFIIADAAKFVLGAPDLPFPYVDNLDASPSDVIGTWSFVGDTSNTWDDGAQFHSGGSGGNTFTFRPLIPADGYYNIHAWWKAGSNRAPDAPYTIKYYNNISEEYETEMITVDQRRDYEGWYCFGNYYLKAGIENFVRLSDQATGYVIADAVWFEADDVPCPPNFYPIVDDLDLDLTEVVGTWTNVSNTDGTWNDNAKYHAAGSGSNTFTFRPHIVESGNYEVYTCWKAGTNRATDARYKIRYYNSGTGEYVETTVGSVNQQQTPDDLLYQGHWWEYLGQFYLEAGTGNYVQLTDEANGYVIADAVFFAKIN